MIKITTAIIATLVLYFMYGLYIAQHGTYIIPGELKRENPKGFYDYRGISNVQTSLSRGSSHPQEVIAEAKKAGLDFLILTDPVPAEKLDTLNSYNGNMLVMNESEFQYLDMRLLHFAGVKDFSPHEINEARLYFTDLLSKKETRDRDNIVVVAHPFNNGPTWTEPFPTGVDGIEVLNPKSLSHKSWMNSKLYVAWSFILYPFNPSLAFLRLFQEPQEEILLWDKLSQKNKVIGFAGADASARAFPFATYLVKFPSYEKSFQIVSNHILIENELNGNYSSDRAKILKALKRGQFYFSIDLLGDPKGFVSYVQEGERLWPLGSIIKYKKGLRLYAGIPIEPNDFYELVVFKNGERVYTSNSPELNYEVHSPGVYRVTVRVSAYLPLPDAKKWITWIYTNPFFVE